VQTYAPKRQDVSVNGTGDLRQALQPRLFGVLSWLLDLFRVLCVQNISDSDADTL